MNARRLPASDGGGRYPGFDVTTQSHRWDETTRRAVMARLEAPAGPRFFTETEQSAAVALFNQLLFQPKEPRIPVMNMVDARLAGNETDGWHYETMPADGQAWRDSLAGLDADSIAHVGKPFAACGWDDQKELLQSIQDLGTDRWHGMLASQVWGLWTRYGCTAFYAHPLAWNEIGFDGPAYPTGYKNIGVDRLEGIEVHDAHSTDNPLPSDVDSAKRKRI